MNKEHNVKKGWADVIYDIQKANVWKRISAYIFDIILIGIAAVGFAFLFSNLLGYDSYASDLSALYEKYETEYRVDFDITASEYDALGESEKNAYDTAIKALSADAEVNYTYSMMLNLTLIMITFGILFAFIIFEFVIPLALHNGQTLGKKIFGVCLIRKDGVKVNALLLFVRTILGKFTLETMIPVLIVIMFYFNVIGVFGTFVILLLFCGQILVVSATKNNLAIHDLLAQTVAVDISSQMIFDSYEDMIEYKKRLHAEDVSRAEYS